MFLRKWINRLFLLFLLITVSCQSLPEIDHSAVQVWKQSHAPDRYISPDLHFAVVAATVAAAAAAGYIGSASSLTTQP